MGEVLIAGTASLLMCIFLSPKFIAFLRRREFGQQIREEGPQEHHAKAGTPTMGGIIIFTAIAVPFLLLTDFDARAVGVFGVAMACALLGFADDYVKLVRRRSLGLRGRTKLVVTMLIAIGLWLVATKWAGLADTVNLRIVDASVDLGVLYPVFIYFVVAGTTSAVNLTDGLDGLAAGWAGVVPLASLATPLSPRPPPPRAGGGLRGDRPARVHRHHLHHAPDRPGAGRRLPGRGVRRLLVVQLVPGVDLHGRHGVTRARRRGGGDGGDDQDRGAADHPRRHLRDRGALGAHPGVLLPGVPQARVPHGPDPPSLRAPGLVGDEDHPALLDRRRGLRRDRLHALPAVDLLGPGAA